jgi:peptide/nickel transport system substrate-binding protein
MQQTAHPDRPALDVLRYLGPDPDNWVRKREGIDYIQKAYTGREFDITPESLSGTFDPTPGVQRVFWSKNFKIGLPFSNASHYNNPEIDQLLEAAAIEPDPVKRKAIWVDFQHKIYDDVAALHLIAPAGVTIANKRVKNDTLGIVGPNASFADVYLEPST